MLEQCYSPKRAESPQYPSPMAAPWVTICTIRMFTLKGWHIISTTNYHQNQLHFPVRRIKHKLVFCVIFMGNLLNFLMSGLQPFHNWGYILSQGVAIGLEYCGLSALFDDIM